MKRRLPTRNQPLQRLPSRRTSMGNIVLVSAAELGSLRSWQDRARRLPSGSALIVIPEGNRLLRTVGKRIIISLQESGHRSVLVSSSADFLS
jgi:hypothetical protein